MKVEDCQGRLKQSDTSNQDYMLKNPSGSNMRIKGGNFQLYNIEEEGWNTVFAFGPIGMEQIALGGIDLSDPDVLTSCT